MTQRTWLLMWSVLLVGWYGLTACSAAASPLVVGPEDHGQTVTLQVGQTLEVRLPANPTTGYEWQVREVDDAVLQTLGEPQFVAEDSERLGAGGVQVWRFQAQAVGTTTLDMVYVRPWETDTPPAERFYLTVTVR